MLHPKTIESIEDFFNKNTIETKALQEALTNVSQVHIDYDTSYNYENLTFRFKESNARVEITPESNNYYLLNVYGSEGYSSCCLKQASQDVEEILKTVEKVNESPNTVLQNEAFKLMNCSKMNYDDAINIIDKTTECKFDEYSHRFNMLFDNGNRVEMYIDEYANTTKFTTRMSNSKESVISVNSTAHFEGLESMRKTLNEISSSPNEETNSKVMLSALLNTDMATVEPLMQHVKESQFDGHSVKLITDNNKEINIHQIYSHANAGHPQYNVVITEDNEKAYISGLQNPKYIINMLQESNSISIQDINNKIPSFSQEDKIRTISDTLKIDPSELQINETIKDLKHVTMGSNNTTYTITENVSERVSFKINETEINAKALHIKSNDTYEYNVNAYQESEEVIRNLRGKSHEQFISQIKEAIQIAETSDYLNKDTPTRIANFLGIDSSEIKGFTEHVESARPILSSDLRIYMEDGTKVTVTNVDDKYYVNTYDGKQLISSERFENGNDVAKYLEDNSISKAMEKAMQEDKNLEYLKDLEHTKEELNLNSLEM